MGLLRSVFKSTRTTQKKPMLLYMSREKPVCKKVSTHTQHLKNTYGKKKFDKQTSLYANERCR